MLEAALQLRNSKNVSFFQIMSEDPGTAVPLALVFIMSAAQCIFDVCITGINQNEPEEYDYAVSLRHERNAESPENRMRQEIRFYREGYGYRFNGTTILLGFMFSLYLHACPCCPPI